ncbi:MAG: PHP domain-containing protein [Negativicutes bacterium]
MSVDLHIHTVASGDGEFSPQEIIQLAKTNQLQAIAVTDHDTVHSVEEAIYWGNKYGIEVISGCEFSSIYKGKWLHVLGYFIDYNHSAVKQWCDRIQKGRLENVDAQIIKLRGGRVLFR